MTEAKHKVISQIMSLPAAERAAAIMHFIYTETIDRPDVDWESDLEVLWIDLGERAKAFNRAILETWTRYPELLEAWQEVLADMSRKSTLSTASNESSELTPHIYNASKCIETVDRG